MNMESSPSSKKKETIGGEINASHPHHSRTISAVSSLGEGSSVGGGGSWSLPRNSSRRSEKNNQFTSENSSTASLNQNSSQNGNDGRQWDEFSDLSSLNQLKGSSSFSNRRPQNQNHGRYPSKGGDRADLQSVDETSTIISYQNATHYPGIRALHAMDDPSKKCAPTNVGVCLSVVGLLLWIILWAFSISENSHYDPFTLTKGETRFLSTPHIRWFHSMFSIQADRETPVGLQVYTIEPNYAHNVGWWYNIKKGSTGCPPLNGPLLHLEQARNITLSGDHYDFDVLHLTPGSRLSVTLQQIEGDTNVFLLQGQAALYGITISSDNEITGVQSTQNRWYSNSDTKPYLKFSFQPVRSDIYILVYENPSVQISSSFDVSYHAELRTHDLQAYHPRCSASESYSNAGCHWKLTDPEEKQNLAQNCLIVKAVGEDDEESSVPPASVSDKDDEATRTITFRYRFTPRYSQITICSLIPCLLGLLAFLILSIQDRKFRTTSEKAQTADDERDQLILAKNSINGHQSTPSSDLVYSQRN